MVKRNSCEPNFYRKKMIPIFLSFFSFSFSFFFFDAQVFFLRSLRIYCLEIILNNIKTSDLILNFEVSLEIENKCWLQQFSGSACKFEIHTLLGLKINWVGSTEAVVRRCSVKRVFLEISQNSQENTVEKWNTSYELRVASSNWRVRRLKARVARLKAPVGRLKAWVRRLKARDEVIKPRVKQ